MITILCAEANEKVNCRVHSVDFSPVRRVRPAYGQHAGQKSKWQHQSTNDERKSNVDFLAFREALKTSGDEVHAALRDAELRVGQALSAGDSAKREAEAARAEVRVWDMLDMYRCPPVCIVEL